MNKELYEMIAYGNYFTHSIGSIEKEDTLEKLDSIFKLNGLYSKSKLRKMNIIVEGMVKGNIRITNDSYISLFDPSGQSIEKRMLSPKLSEYFPIKDTDIMFLIDTSIEYSPNVKRNEFDYHEIIVKDYLPLDYFFGIVVPNDELAINKLDAVLKEYNIDIPIYDYEGKIIDLNNRTK